MSVDDELDENGREALSLLAQALEPAAPAPSVRARLLEQLRGPERFSPFVAEVASAFDLSADALREAFATLQSGRWLPGPWPHSRLLVAPALGGDGTLIAQLAAGTEIRRHGHAHRELTYVLDGALCEDAQRTLGAGELLVAEPGQRHTVTIASDSDCLVVFGVRP